LIDPNVAPLRALPREDRDLFIAANNAHTLVFDNVSGLPNEVWPWTEDEEAEYWKGFGEVTHIGFYGGAPHRPKG